MSACLVCRKHQCPPAAPAGARSLRRSLGATVSMPVWLLAVLLAALLSLVAAPAVAGGSAPAGFREGDAGEGQVYYWAEMAHPDVLTRAAGTNDTVSMHTGPFGTFVAFADEDARGRGGANSLSVAHWDAAAETWRFLGGRGSASDGEVRYVSLAVSAAGDVLVAYKDLSCPGRSRGVTAVRLGYGGQWDPVGSPCFSLGEVFDVQLSLDAAGTPSVAFQDSVTASRPECQPQSCASVMTHSPGAPGPYGTEWSYVGRPGFTDAAAASLSMVHGRDGPVVAFVDYSCPAQASGATVLAMTGGSWAPVGGRCFTPSGVYELSLALDGAGTPHVVVSDDGVANRATLYRHGAGAWEAVGGRGVTAGWAHSFSLAFSPHDGAPWFGYSDQAHDNKASVLRLDPADGAWKYAGSPGFTNATVRFLSLGLASDGTPVIAFRDDGSDSMRAFGWGAVPAAEVPDGFAAPQAEPEQRGSGKAHPCERADADPCATAAGPLNTCTDTSQGKGDPMAYTCTCGAPGYGPKVGGSPAGATGEDCKGGNALNCACVGIPEATPAPTTAPTEAATPAPTTAPTAAPTEAATPAPTTAPTEAATPAPTTAPTTAPTAAPTEAATPAPTTAPVGSSDPEPSTSVSTPASTAESGLGGIGGSSPSPSEDNTDGNAPGNSGSAPGQDNTDGNAPGNSGNAPGQDNTDGSAPADGDAGDAGTVEASDEGASQGEDGPGQGESGEGDYTVTGSGDGEHPKDGPQDPDELGDAAGLGKGGSLGAVVVTDETGAVDLAFLAGVVSSLVGIGLAVGVFVQRRARRALAGKVRAAGPQAANSRTEMLRPRGNPSQRSLDGGDSPRASAAEPPMVRKGSLKAPVTVPGGAVPSKGGYAPTSPRAAADLSDLPADGAPALGAAPARQGSIAKVARAVSSAASALRAALSGDPHALARAAAAAEGHPYEALGDGGEGAAAAAAAAGAAAGAATLVKQGSAFKDALSSIRRTLSKQLTGRGISRLASGAGAAKKDPRDPLTRSLMGHSAKDGFVDSLSPDAGSDAGPSPALASAVGSEGAAGLTHRRGARIVGAGAGHAAIGDGHVAVADAGARGAHGAHGADARGAAAHGAPDLSATTRAGAGLAAGGAPLAAGAFSAIAKAARASLGAAEQPGAAGAGVRGAGAARGPVDGAGAGAAGAALVGGPGAAALSGQGAVAGGAPAKADDLAARPPSAKKMAMFSSAELGPHAQGDGAAGQPGAAGAAGTGGGAGKGARMVFESAEAPAVAGAAIAGAGAGAGGADAAAGTGAGGASLVAGEGALVTGAAAADGGAGTAPRPNVKASASRGKGALMVGEGAFDPFLAEQGVAGASGGAGGVAARAGGAAGGAKLVSGAAAEPAMVGHVSAKAPAGSDVMAAAGPGSRLGATAVAGGSAPVGIASARVAGAAAEGGPLATPAQGRGARSRLVSGDGASPALAAQALAGAGAAAGGVLAAATGGKARGSGVAGAGGEFVAHGDQAIPGAPADKPRPASATSSRMINKSHLARIDSGFVNLADAGVQGAAPASGAGDLASSAGAKSQRMMIVPGSEAGAALAAQEIKGSLPKAASSETLGSAAAPPTARMGVVSDTGAAVAIAAGAAGPARAQQAAAALLAQKGGPGADEGAGAALQDDGATLLMKGRKGRK